MSETPSREAPAVNMLRGFSGFHPDIYERHNQLAAVARFIIQTGPDAFASLETWEALWDRAHELEKASFDAWMVELDSKHGLDLITVKREEIAR